MQSAANSSLDSMKFAENEDIEEVVYISGFPEYPKPYLFCSSLLRNQPENEIIKIMNEAFCGFEKEVISIGSVKKLRIEPNMLLAADYTATNGMSGGPIYVEKQGQKFLIGINCGGCSIPFQNEIALIIPLILLENFELAIRKLFEIKESIIKSDAFDLSLLANKIQFLELLFNHKNSNESVKGLLNFINILPLAYRYPEELNHNLSVPIWSDAMRRVKFICEAFMVLPPITFNSVEDLFQALTK